MSLVRHCDYVRFKDLRIADRRSTLLEVSGCWTLWSSGEKPPTKQTRQSCRRMNIQQIIGGQFVRTAVICSQTTVCNFNARIEGRTEKYQIAPKVG
jgi:hypothetical protein